MFVYQNEKDGASSESKLRVAISGHGSTEQRKRVASVSRTGWPHWSAAYLRGHGHIWPLSRPLTCHKTSRFEHIWTLCEHSTFGLLAKCSSMSHRIQCTVWICMHHLIANPCLKYVFSKCASLIFMVLGPIRPIQSFHKTLLHSQVHQSCHLLRLKKEERKHWQRRTAQWLWVILGMHQGECTDGDVGLGREVADTSARVKSYQILKVVSGGRAPGKSSSLASPQLLVIERFHCFGAVRLEKVYFFVYCVDF